MLTNKSVTEFLAETASNQPVPGGGSVAAMCGALAASLGAMVANLTIGRKKYADVEETMRRIAGEFDKARSKFEEYINLDALAYAHVMEAYRMPKETPEELQARNNAIAEATFHAAEVPMTVALEAARIMSLIERVALEGNRNAVTDACVAMMNARTAVLGAVLNTRINLVNLPETDEIADMNHRCQLLVQQAIEQEQQLLSAITI
ncbi:MAG: cyclodeaminase/cyclohydrolase family protein [Muribaculaceae bacterium]|nr:cyclodeaminase/cyclohydrolase family protein [Muribaculaceae bacterium]MDE6321292.1 cyclodeaminase/cyclohydrolase family protein [Muribaculaceae bacterium]